VAYSDGSVRYYCSDHKSSKQTMPTSAGEHGDKRFNPWFCIAIVTGFTCVNLVRAVPGR
jgi:hypothetical protein